MRAISRGFVKDLNMVDPSLMVRFNESLNYFEIYKIVDRYIEKKNGGYHQLRRETIRAVFDNLNDSAISDLRKRQYLANLHNAKGDPHAYTRLLRRENKQARAKAHQRGSEMIAAGLRKMYMVGRQKYFT